MTRKRSRKVPLASSSGPTRSARRARVVTSEFHKLSRELSAAHARGDAAAVERLRTDIDSRRREYQDASILTTSQFKTSRWVLQVLRALDACPPVGVPPLRTLEVGAINTQLVACRFMKTRAIDIQSRHPQIEVST